MTDKKNQPYLFAFILVTSLFFLWGFIHNLDPILIPHLRSAFLLNNVQGALVDFSVFVAYFIMAIPASNIMLKYGYKTGIIIGLLLFAAGCFLIMPAANMMLYEFFLLALFVIACGLAILETAANPYITILGKPETAAQRLNFAQAFNGLAASIAPIIGAKLILADNPLEPSQVIALDSVAREAYVLSQTSLVKPPYLILGFALLVIVALFAFTKLPDKKETDVLGKQSFLHAFSLLKIKHLKWAVIAQFFYVGAQVCIMSMMANYVLEILKIDKKDAGTYSMIIGVMFFAGRFVGTFLMRYIQPHKLLTIYSIICAALCIYVIIGSGINTVYSLYGVSFFMSIMFPTIFALGIRDLGVETKSGSSLIIMSIVGGALLPLIWGLVADKSHIQHAYIVPLICFLVVGYYGWKKHLPEGKTV